MKFSKEKFGSRMKYIRSLRNMTQSDISMLLDVSVPSVSKYEAGLIEPNVDTLGRIADILRVSPLYLLGMSDDPEMENTLPPNVMPMPETSRLPILGTIACGEPILAQENYDGYAEVPALFHADFVLRCKGDSMIGARIKDGDCVYIRQQPDVENGEIAAVLIGSEATLKRVYKKPGYIVLQPENPAYEPIIVTAADEPVRILGKAVGFSSPI